MPRIVGHWRNRLSPAMRRVYDRSDALRTIPLRPGAALLETVGRLRSALESGNRRQVGQLAQQIADEICANLRVPNLRVVVQGRRPSSAQGELYGLYTPGEHDRRDTVKLWMITAKRKQVVAFRTFLRTLLHEICHHLDYTLLDLSESYHTEGFYVRESGMVRSLVDGPGHPQSSSAPVGRGGRGGRGVPAGETGRQR